MIDPLQIIIVLSGMAAIGLLALGGRWDRLGFFIGLIGQPAWLIVTALNQQWGMFAVSVWYTFAFGRGLWRSVQACERPAEIDEILSRMRSGMAGAREADRLESILDGRSPP